MYDEKIVIPTATPTVTPTTAPTKEPTKAPTKAPSKTTVVQTGDNTPVVQYLLLFAVAALGLALALWRRRRNA
jgi:MYXO-CTERM domain-containing protein